jgi:hypothetical protein
MHFYMHSYLHKIFILIKKWVLHMVTPGLRVSCCQVYTLARISATPLDMGDGLFTTSKRRIINFIIIMR